MIEINASGLSIQERPLGTAAAIKTPDVKAQENELQEEKKRLWR